MPKITQDTKIALGLPRGKDGFTWEWIECLLKMFARYPAKYVPLSEQRPHAQARNAVGQRFLQSEADYLLWIDSDTIWEPEDLQALMDVISDDVQIVTGIQFTTGNHRLPLIRKLNLEYGVAEPFASLPSDPRPFEIDGCGFGFVLMTREVLERTPEPWFEFKSGFSEDLYFCIQAKLAGFRIAAQPTALVGHIGTKVWTVRDYWDIPEDMRQVYVQNALVGSHNYLKKMHPNWRKELRFDELATERTMGENINLKEGYWDNVYKGEVNSGFNWRTYPGKFPFISQELLKDLPKDAKVLDLGSGLGILLEQIRKDHPEFKLQAMDISSYAVEHMKNKGIDAQVGVLPQWIDGVEEKYDSVIACEVLEHLDEDDRKQTVQGVYNILKEGGIAIFTLPDNTMPPSEIREHRVCYNKETFEKFLHDAFNGSIEVYSKRALVSDVPRADGLSWAEAPFLFGICIKKSKEVNTIKENRD